MVDLFFYIAAGLSVLCALGVVVAKNPVVSVLALLGCFFNLAVIYLLAGFQFLAAIQILVYGGAIMVLFLFVIMLLNLGGPSQNEEEVPIFYDRRRSTGGLAVAVAMGAASLIGILRGVRHLPESGAADQIPEQGLDALSGLAEAMFTRYSLPFEAASVLLLCAAVGVMILAKRERPGAPAKEKP